jgi:hypothetical protein
MMPCLSRVEQLAPRLERFDSVIIDFVRAHSS